MNIKHIYSCIFCCAILLSTGCRKNESLDFQFNDNLNTVPNELDEWLTKTFTDPYNIEVIYRFDRYKTELVPILVPPKEDKVADQMNVILKGYILPYQLAGGVPFVKTYLPKQWVLSGSHNIGADGSGISGISTGGRNITLFDVNTLNMNNAYSVKEKLSTVHHEFTHTLNQIKPLSKQFEDISKEHYTESWKNEWLHPNSENDALGFISRYARSSVLEDFAETVKILLVDGQLWYDMKAGSVPASGYEVLKKKEMAVVNYYRDSYGLDFRELQRQVLYALYNDLNDKDMQSFKYWFFEKEAFNRNLSLNTANATLDFKNIFDEFKNKVPTISTIYAAYGKWNLNDLQLIFTPSQANSGDLVIRAIAAEAFFPARNIDFTFKYQFDPITKKVKFTKSFQNTADPNSDLAKFMPHFLPISNYFTGSEFAADWSVDDENRSRLSEDFFKTAGFYKVDNRQSFVNFTLQNKKSN